ncbi:hypothetical protein LTR66_017514 [Elasticomyces elasticus]|nr:hypothetical protein LTR66_017514 [Elasticomyces elasticus]
MYNDAACSTPVGDVMEQGKCLSSATAHIGSWAASCGTTARDVTDTATPNPDLKVRSAKFRLPKLIARALNFEKKEANMTTNTTEASVVTISITIPVLVTSTLTMKKNCSSSAFISIITSSAVSWYNTTIAPTPSASVLTMSQNMTNYTSPSLTSSPSNMVFYLPTKGTNVPKATVASKSAGSSSVFDGSQEKIVSIGFGMYSVLATRQPLVRKHVRRREEKPHDMYQSQDYLPQIHVSIILLGENAKYGIT